MQQYRKLSRTSFISTRTSCYAAVGTLALPHIRHATLLKVLLHFHTCVMPRYCLRFHTHTRQATLGSLALPQITSCYDAVGSLAHPHIRHATLLLALPHIRQATLL